MTTILFFISTLANILAFAVFIRAILSWFSMAPNNILIVVLYQITDPVLEPLRRVVPRIGMIDITPLVAIILLQLIAQIAQGALL